MRGIGFHRLDPSIGSDFRIKTAGLGPSTLAAKLDAPGIRTHLRPMKTATNKTPPPASHTHQGMPNTGSTDCAAVVSQFGPPGCAPIQLIPKAPGAEKLLRAVETSLSACAWAELGSMPA